MNREYDEITDGQKILVLGIGNPLLGDDGIGIRLVNDLQRQWKACQNLTFHQTSQSGLYLLDLFCDYDFLIIVDAVLLPDRPPGEVIDLPFDSIRSRARGASPHYIGLDSVISLGREMGLNMPEEIYIIGVVIHEGNRISPHLSPALKKQYPDILKVVTERIQSRLKKFSATGADV